MNNEKNLKSDNIEYLDNEELKVYQGGTLTTKQEVWLERGIAFVLLGLTGILIYELGRANG